MYASWIPPGLYHVKSTGGTPALIGKPDPTKGERALAWPELLPGAQWIVFTILSDSEPEGRIVAQSLRSGERKMLLEQAMNAQYSSTGHLIFSRKNNLMTVPFDIRRIEVTGSPKLVVENIARTRYGAAQFTFSELPFLYLKPSPTGKAERSLVWVDRAGHVEPLRTRPRAYRNPSLSPDGQRLAEISGCTTCVATVGQG